MDKKILGTNEEIMPFHKLYWDTPTPSVLRNLHEGAP